MAPNRQIGWSTEEILLSDILKQIERLATVIGGGGGSGSVTSVSVVSANGFAGSVATAITTPAITISTTITGIIKGNGTAISAAVAGTDYLLPNGSGAALTGVYLLASGGTLTGTNTIVQAGFNTTHTGTGKVTFSPSATLSGLNVGSLAGDPSTPSAGDVWFNSTQGIWNLRHNAFSGFVITTSGVILTQNRIPFAGTINRLFDSANLTFVTNRLLGTTLYLTVSAGTATAGTAPLKMTSGTNLTTAEAGAFEYNGTNLFFTRTGTTRQTVLTANVVTTETVVSNTTVTVNIAGTDIKLLAIV